MPRIKAMVALSLGTGGKNAGSKKTKIIHPKKTIDLNIKTSQEKSEFTIVLLLITNN